MNNLIISVYKDNEPELGELISDSSTHVEIKVEIEPMFDLKEGKAWYKRYEIAGSTYGVYIVHMNEEEPKEEIEEPDQELIDIYKKYALEDEGDEPVKRVLYRCEHQGHCKLYHAQGVEIEPDDLEEKHFYNWHPYKKDEPDYGNPHTKETKYQRMYQWWRRCMNLQA